MAYYNPRTDEIIDCREGSYNWEHENRHRDQYKGGIAKTIDTLHVLWSNVAFITGSAGLLFWGWRGMIIGIGFPMFPHILGLLYLEIDAYIVGFYRYWKKRIRRRIS